MLLQLSDSRHSCSLACSLDLAHENDMESIETSGSALATGSINARFISQNKLDEANDRRDQEWKEAYAR